MRMRRRAELDKICLVAVVTDKGSDVFRIWSAVDIMALVDNFAALFLCNGHQLLHGFFLDGGFNINPADA